MGKPEIWIISKDVKNWLEKQRIMTQALHDEATGEIKDHSGGRLEFIELIQEYIKEGLIKIMEDL